MANADLRSVLPNSVTVVYPRADSGVVGSSVYAHTVTLVSLEIPEYPGFVGHAGTHVIRSTVIATFSGGGTPTNLAELTALSNAVARDFYRYRAARVDLRLIGVPPWEPSGLDDHFEITYRLDNLSTRVQRPAWNEAVEELPISGTGGSSTTINVFNDPVTFNNIVTFNDPVTYNDISVYNQQVTFNESITLNQYFQFPRTNVTLNVNQNNYNLTDTTVVLKINATADFDFTGIDNGVGGRFLWIENLIGSTGTVTLKHQSGSSSADNRIVSPDLGDYPIPPGSKVCLDYNETDDFWYIVGVPRWPRYAQTTWNTSQNNYPIPPGIGLIKANVTADVDLTGIAAPSAEVPYLLTIENRPSSTNSLSILHLSGSSSAGNQIQTDTGSPVVLAPGQSVQLQYDPLDDVWIMIGRANGTGGGGGGTVTSVAMTVPTFLGVAGSPITTSGTFAVTWSGLTDHGVLYADGTTNLAQAVNTATDDHPRYLRVIDEVSDPEWSLIRQVWPAVEVFSAGGDEIAIGVATMHLFFELAGADDLSGIVAPIVSGVDTNRDRQLIYISVSQGSTHPLTILHNNALSSAGTRFFCPHDIDYVVEPGQGVAAIFVPQSGVFVAGWQLMVGNEGVYSVNFTPPTNMAVSGVPDTDAVAIVVTWTGLASGDLIYGTGSTTTDNLAIGSTDQVLTVTSGLPSWKATKLRTFSGALVNLTAAQTIATGTPEDIGWSEIYDTDSYFSGGNAERLTVPRDGIYLAVAQVRWANTTDPSTGLRRVRIQHRTSIPSDTTVADQWFQIDPDSGISPAQNLSVVVRMNSGDWLAVLVSHNGGENLDIFLSDSPTTFSIHLLDEDP